MSFFPYTRNVNILAKKVEEEEREKEYKGDDINDTDLASAICLRCENALFLGMYNRQRYAIYYYPRPSSEPLNTIHLFLLRDCHQVLF